MEEEDGWGSRADAGSLPLLAGALALVVGGCGGGNDDNGRLAAAAQPQDASTKPIKIGASLPLTGDFSEPGKAAQQGYEVWASMINAKGGLLGRKVQLVDQGRRVQPEHRRRRTTTR